MEQETLTRDAPGIVPQSPTAPPQAASLPGAPGAAQETPGEVPAFPDASGSLSSILASLGESGEKPPPPPPSGSNRPSKHPQRAAIPNGDNPYPDIMLMPLPRQDALRIKWGLGSGLPNVSTLSDEELSRLAIGSEADKPSNSLRLYGMFPSGEPWETRLTFDELKAAPHGIIIGRDPGECSIVISEDSVSRRHALLEMTADGLVISDLDSRNGTSVDDHTLTRYDRCVPLNDGSTINLGEVTIRVEILQ